MSEFCQHCKNLFSTKCQDCLQHGSDGRWHMRNFDSKDSGYAISTAATPDLSDMTHQVGQALYERGCMACKHRGNYSRCIGCMQTVNGVLSLTAFEQLGMDHRVQ